MKFNFGILVALVIFIAIGCGRTNEPEREKKEAIGMYSGPIIDMHIHAYGEKSPLFGRPHPPTLRAQTFQGAKSAGELKRQVFEKFEHHRIVKAVVIDGQNWSTDAPDQVIIAGAKKPVDSLRKQHSDGQLQVIGEMAPFYAGIQADDPSQLPYFELAQELGIPVGIHVFPGGPNYGFHIMPEMLGGMRAYNANPMQLEDVLVQYPNLKLYIMHGGWPYIEDVKALMYAHPNVYVDIAVLNWILPKEELYKYINALIDSGFGDRIMHGSDQMVWPETIDIAIETINAAEFLTLEQKEDIFYDNAAAFLELSEEEIKRHKSP